MQFKNRSDHLDHYDTVYVNVTGLVRVKLLHTEPTVAIVACQPQIQRNFGVGISPLRGTACFCGKGR